MRLTALLLLSVAAVALYSAWRLPGWRPPEAARHDRATGPASPDQEDEHTPAASSSEVWKRRLRRPLYDPPPPPPPEVVKKKLPPLKSKLLGTVIEPGASQAMIDVPGKGVQFRSQGERLGPHDGDAVLVEIGPASVKVARGEEVTELKVESPF